METTDIKNFENRTENAIKLLAFLEAKKGKESELERILLNLIPPTLKESGNIAYVLHKSLENPLILCLMSYGKMKKQSKSISSNRI